MTASADTLSLAELVLRLRAWSHAHSRAEADALMQHAAKQIERLLTVKRVTLLGLHDGHAAQHCLPLDGQFEGRPC